MTDEGSLSSTPVCRTFLQKGDRRGAFFSRLLRGLADGGVGGPLVRPVAVPGRGQSGLEAPGLHGPAGLQGHEHQPSLPGMRRQTRSPVRRGVCVDLCGHGYRVGSSDKQPFTTLSKAHPDRSLKVTFVPFFILCRSDP